MTAPLRTVRSYTRSAPGKSVEYLAMQLVLADAFGRPCPVRIEPMTLDDVLAAALALELAAFGEDS